jgi:hypothetical protein
MGRFLLRSLLQKEGIMRILRTWLLVSVLALPWTGTLPLPQSADAGGVAIAQENAPAQAPDIDVNINGGEKKYVVWLSNPVVLAAGAVAMLVFIMLIVMAARGGGTTIVKD